MALKPDEHVTAIASAGSTAHYLERLGDAVLSDPDGRYRLADAVFALWLSWRIPGGTVVPMAVVGDEGEQRVAATLARMGFDLVYVSRASRGAFDLLATRGAHQLGLQVRARALPLRFTRAEWGRMEAEAARFGWSWMIAAVSPQGGDVVLLDPGAARLGREVRIGVEAQVENLLQWVDTQERRARTRETERARV